MFTLGDIFQQWVSSLMIWARRQSPELAVQGWPSTLRGLRLAGAQLVTVWTIVALLLGATNTNIHAKTSERAALRNLVKFEEAVSVDFQKRFLAGWEELYSTDPGKELIEMARKSGGIEVVEDPKGLAGGNGKIAAYSKGKYGTSAAQIDDLKQHHELPRFTSARKIMGMAIGHELGHALPSLSFESELKVINRCENPIRKSMGVGLRTTHHGKYPD